MLTKQQTAQANIDILNAQKTINENKLLLAQDLTDKQIASQQAAIAFADAQDAQLLADQQLNQA